MARISKEGLVTVAAGAAGLASVVTPDWRSWWLAGPLWTVAAVAALRWWIVTRGGNGEEEREYAIVHQQLEELRDLIRFGTDTLLNADLGPNQSQWSLEGWRERTSQWRQDALGRLARVGATEREKSNFETLVTFTSQNLPGVSPEHARLRNILAERIHRLRAILGQVEARHPRP